MSKRPQRTCFIAAPFGVDTTIVRHELEKLRVRWTDITNAPMGATVVDAIRTAIAKADFVCVLAPKATSSRWTLFEAGIAVGTGKPLLLIADRDFPFPSDLPGLHYVLAGPQDTEAIRFHLRSVIDGLDKRKGKITIRPSTRPTKSTPRKGGRHFESEPESRVAQLFEQSGYLQHEVETPHQRDSGFDLAVWIDELVPIFSSPILAVEVKGPPFAVRPRGDAVARLQSAVHTHSAGAGLIVYVGRPSTGRRQTKWECLSAPPFVFSVDVGELQKTLTDHSLVKRLTETRNRAVHGG